MAFRIVRPWQKGLIERLGKYNRTVDSGLQIVIPLVERLILVDMREQVVDVPPQSVITQDNVMVEVDAVVYYQVIDPMKVTYNVADFYNAAIKLTQTNLRNLIGDLALDESLTSRETINTKLRIILDEATDKWGVQVTRVELQRIEPPQDVTAAMHRQMKAERDRRATILEAEGHKQAAILKSEGDAEAVRLVAAAEKFRERTIAGGEADAIRATFAAIAESDLSPELLAIKYLETLRHMADGKATKVYLPYEAVGILGSLAGIGDLFQTVKTQTPATDVDEQSHNGVPTQS